MIEILLPVYNGEKYLREQIDSIINQNFFDWVLKIRNDGSKDDSQKIINEYCCRFPGKIIEIDSPKNNIGLLQSINYLLKSEPYGEYVMFSDQDDVWLSDKIDITLKKMKELENTFENCPIAVFTDLMVVDKKLNILHDSYFESQRIFPDACKNYMSALALNVAPGCTIMINKIAKQCIYPLKSLIHDYWIICNVAYYGKCDYINRPTILYRQHGNNSIGAENVGFKYLIKRLQRPFSAIKVFNQGLNQFNFPISRWKFWYFKIELYFKRFIS